MCAQRWIQGKLEPHGEPKCRHSHDTHRKERRPVGGSPDPLSTMCESDSLLGRRGVAASLAPHTDICQSLRERSSLPLKSVLIRCSAYVSEEVSLERRSFVVSSVMNLIAPVCNGGVGSKHGIDPELLCMPGLCQKVPDGCGDICLMPGDLSLAMERS